jgi:N-acetyl-1-D-myo-inositol-2-amino-2-deoxy-alpha-D-glucopyranoside deacetylase
MTAGHGDLEGRSLLAVFAHPDDESLASGGLLAWCTARGARVSLLCLSRGEAGHGGGKERLGEVRARELRDAADALGLSEYVLLSHPDGMLPWLDEGTLERDVRRQIDASRPDVVVTFGEDGLYWHPDHIAVHEATRAAVMACGATAPALYYVTMPPGQMEAVLAAAAPRLSPGARRDLLGIDNAAAFGAAAQPPTLVLRTGPFAARRLAALRCHRTQVEGGPFDQLSAAEAEALLGVEHYRRADVGSTGPAFIERLATASLESS